MRGCIRNIYGIIEGHCSSFGGFLVCSFLGSIYTSELLCRNLRDTWQERSQVVVGGVVVIILYSFYSGIQYRPPQPQIRHDAVPKRVILMLGY